MVINIYQASILDDSGEDQVSFVEGQERRRWEAPMGFGRKISFMKQPTISECSLCQVRMRDDIFDDTITSSSGIFKRNTISDAVKNVTKYKTNTRSSVGINNIFGSFGRQWGNFEVLRRED